MAWTDEQIADLKRLWHDDVSAREIGEKLGISKNSVIGKAHRLQLPSRPSPITRGGTGSHNASQTPGASGESRKSGNSSGAKVRSDSSKRSRQTAERTAAPAQPVSPTPDAAVSAQPTTHRPDAAVSGDAKGAVATAGGSGQGTTQVRPAPAGAETSAGSGTSARNGGREKATSQAAPRKAPDPETANPRGQRASRSDTDKPAASVTYWETAAGQCRSAPSSQHGRATDTAAMPSRDTQTKSPPAQPSGEEARTGARACAWPIGDPDDPDFHFCGAPSIEGKPYCAEHAARAYISKSKSSGGAAAASSQARSAVDADTSEDVSVSDASEDLPADDQAA